MLRQGFETDLTGGPEGSRNFLYGWVFLSDMRPPRYYGDPAKSNGRIRSHEHRPDARRPRLRRGHATAAAVLLRGRRSSAVEDRGVGAGDGRAADWSDQGAGGRGG